MATAKKVTVGSLIDKMNDLRNQRRKIAKEDEELKSEYSAVETQLIELMDKEGVSKSTGKSASAGIGSSEQFNIVDWDKFTEFVIKKKMVHLLQRRVSVDAAREVFERSGQVPGLEPFTKRTINLRSL